MNKLLFFIGLLLPILSWAANPDELLSPQDAFKAEVTRTADDQVMVRFDIAPGYYLYKHRLGFSVKDIALSLGEAQPPKGKVKIDEFFGEVENYRNEVFIPIPLSVIDDSVGYVDFFVTSQGCADLGVCYPPDTQTLTLDLTTIEPLTRSIDYIHQEPADSLINKANSAAFTAPLNKPDNNSTPVAFVSEQDRIADNLAEGTWFTIASFFGLGLLLAFTPCVFPMIPILSGIIVGQGEAMSTRKGLTYSIVYVLAMSVTYTVAGVLVGLSGENIQVWFQSPWVLGTFALIFVGLSLAMFGFYELQMPAAIQSRLTQASNSQKGGTLVGVAIMGFLSALIVGPCVTAPLIGALIYIAQTGDAVLGGLALFALSLGMGAPLIAIGMSAGRWLPKAGLWMDKIKAVFGVLLLATAVWMLERVMPVQVTMILYGLLFIVSAIYLGALDTAQTGWSRLWKGFGVASLLIGVILFVGAASGSNSLLSPLNGLAGNDRVQDSHLSFQQVKGLDGLQNAIAQANGRPVLFDFYADWCVSCKEMEAFTFTDDNVQQQLADFVLLQTDVTDNDEQDQALLKSLGLFGPPAILFYDPDGNEATPFRVVGFMNAEKFHQHIQQFRQNS